MFGKVKQLRRAGKCLSDHDIARSEFERARCVSSWPVSSWRTSATQIPKRRIADASPVRRKAGHHARSRHAVQGRGATTGRRQAGVHLGVAVRRTQKSHLKGGFSASDYGILRNYFVFAELNFLMKNQHRLINAGARSRNRTGTPLLARDFKSRVSTSFTIRAARGF